MTSRLFKEAAAAAIVLLSLNSVAQAENDACTTATLKGTYGTKIHAQALGILTGTAPNQVFHPYAARGVVDGVALQTFDGAGAGTQKDFVMLDGARTPGSPPDFESNEMLSYTMNADCTGELRITFPSGNLITSRFVVVDQGNEMFGVTSAQHNAGGPPALDLTPCDKGCDLAIQTSTHSVRVGEGRGHEHER